MKLGFSPLRALRIVPAPPLDRLNSASPRFQSLVLLVAGGLIGWLLGVSF